LAFYKKYARTVFDVALILLTALLIMYILSFLLHIAAPIFIGYLIFLMIEPLASFLNKRGLKKTFAATFSVLLFIVAVVAIFLLLGVILTVQIQNLIEIVPLYFDSVETLFLNTIQWVQTQLNALPPDVVDKAQDYSSIFFSEATSLVSGFLGGAFYMLTSIPTLLFNFLIGIVLAFFLSIEVEMWRRLLREKSPQSFRKAYFFLKDHVFSGIGAYLKAQMKLIGATFVIVLIGLLILRIDNAFSVALLAAFFDLLPLLGVSAVFIPWSIYLFIVGEISLGVWLLVLLGIVIVFRQFMEPRIMGDSLGVSAFTVLAFMILSLSLFGVAGVILSPLLIILIKALYENGYLKIWIHMPEGEFEQKDEKPA
jgi:sporulation integral membrane protein YtvI